MTATIILGWLYLCAMCFSIMMILDNCSKEEAIMCIPWFLLGPIWILICLLIIRPIRKKIRKMKKHRPKEDEDYVKNQHSETN